MGERPAEDRVVAGSSPAPGINPISLMPLYPYALKFCFTFQFFGMLTIYIYGSLLEDHTKKTILRLKR